MRSLVLLLALGLVPFAVAGVAPEREMAAPRAAHTATLLQSGHVLIAGGCTRPGCGTDNRSASTELFDPADRTFSPGPDMSRRRDAHTATLLTDGSVLITGGYPGEGEPPSATAELYDQTRKEFMPLGPMTSPRGGSTATRLRDGRVLIAGGSDAAGPTATAELFDPRTRAFTATLPMAEARAAHAAALLSDGRVLLVGGRNNAGRVLSSAEIYNPRTGRFTPAGRLRQTRHKHAAVALRGGSILVVGGSDETDSSGRRATAEIFDARRGRSLRLVQMKERRFKLGNAVVRLPSGEVLVAGGGVNAEIYDPRTARFRIAGRLGTRLSFATATRLRSGGVLVAGGYDDRIAVTPKAWTFHG